MSKSLGIKALNLEMTKKIPHTQYISNDEYIYKKTGINTKKLKDNDEKSILVDSAIANALDYDFIGHSYEMPVGGRTTNMGHAVWSEVNKKDTKVSCPFKSVDDVLDFKPLDEYILPSTDLIAKSFKEHLNKVRNLYTDGVIPGGRYNTLFSACIRAFGWEMFLSSAAKNEKKFNRILEGFAEISLTEIMAWTRTDIEVFICHDDITWTSGAVFSPNWYRKYIFPQYERLWKPLRDKGIKVLFCSDGNYAEFIDDIAKAGADGFIFEPCTSLEYVADKYGKTKVIIGNADCRILQFGKKKDIRKEVKRCIDIGLRCPGYFMAVGNHIPNGISVDNIEYYFKCFEEMRYRGL